MNGVGKQKNQNKKQEKERKNIEISERQLDVRAVYTMAKNRCNVKHMVVCYRFVMTIDWILRAFGQWQ